MLYVLYCKLYICIVSFVACTCIVCCNFVYSDMEEWLCQMPEFKYINQIKSIKSPTYFPYSATHDTFNV